MIKHKQDSVRQIDRLSECDFDSKTVSLTVSVQQEVQPRRHYLCNVHYNCVIQGYGIGNWVSSVSKRPFVLLALALLVSIEWR